MNKSRNNKIYEFEDFRLDAAHLLLYQNERQISLAPKVVETLLALVERHGAVLSKVELMEIVWADSIVEESNLSQNLYLLRKTLGEMPDGKSYIETLKRRGYRFNGAARVSEKGNGFSSAEVENHETENTNGHQPKNSNPRPLRVERRGNVLALADWRESEAKPEAVEHAATPEDERQYPAADSKFKYLFAAAVVAFAGIILLAVFSLDWFKSPAAQINSVATDAKNELTILPLTNGENVSWATIAPDGQNFAYSEYGDGVSRLWLHQVGETNRLEIVAPQQGAIHRLTFTPNSKTIYFLHREKSDAPDTLYRVSTLGGVPTKILDRIDSPVSFSPGGEEIVFTRTDADKSALVIASSDGARERILLTKEKPEAIGSFPAWSPDGGQIAFGFYHAKPQSEGNWEIVGFDLQSGTTKPLSAEKWDVLYRTAWTRDGAGLVFIGTKPKESVTTRRDQIYYLAVHTGESRRLTTDGNRYDDSSLGVTDAGEILALSYNRVSQIWAMDARSGDSRTARQITKGQSDGRGAITPLPDGRIFFMSRTGDDFGIFQTNGDGESRSLVLSHTPSIEDFTLAPDGRFFIFAAKSDGLIHLFRTDADGANRRQITFGESNDTEPAVSPDGNWIVYTTDVFDGGKLNQSLQKISSDGDGGEPVRLADWCGAPRFSPDGKMISCSDASAGKIRVISFENGATLKTFEAAKVPVLYAGAHWTPDGKNLIYIVAQKNVCNLWQQPIGGGKARPLTDFTSGWIYNFAFASDGSRLYLARGNPIRNAMLIKNFR